METKKEEQKEEIKVKSPEEKVNQDYPVEVKENEQSHNSIDEDIDSSIKASVRKGFIRKVYGILSIQLLIKLYHPVFGGSIIL